MDLFYFGENHPSNNSSKWAEEQRIQNFKIEVENADSYVDEVNVRKFLKIMNFMVKSFYNVETRILEQKIIENFLHELKCYTQETLHKFINKKASKYLETYKEKAQGDKIFDYSVKTFKLELLDETDAFLRVEIYNLEGAHSLNIQKHESLEIKIKNFKVINLLNKSTNQNVLVSCLNEAKSKDSYNFMMSLEKFMINGKIHENKWKVYNNINAELGTIVANFSLDIFEKIYDFIWMNQLDNPLFMDDQDLKRDSEVAEFFFYYPNDFLKKKKEISKKKKKDFEDKNKDSQQIKSIPSLYRRFTIGKSKIYLNYKAGFPLLVNLLETQQYGASFRCFFCTGFVL